MAILRYPIFAKNGDTVNLQDLYSDTSFSYDTDFSAPSWLSLNNNNQLVIAANAVSKVTPIIIRLNLNRCFYLVVSPNTVPTVRSDATELSMLANSSFDLFLIVENADTITFQSGQTQLTGSSITDGVFTAGRTSGVAYFTARNAAGPTNFRIKINIVSVDKGDVISDAIRYRVEIAGIDVTPDLVRIPTISETLDAVILDEYRVNNTTVVLKDSHGKYNSGVTGNFWETNSLNPNGYQEKIQVFKEHREGENWNSYLRFSGIITQATASLENVTVSLACVDISFLLRKRSISGFGTLEKWEVLDTESSNTDRIFEYNPDESLLPIQPDTAEAWHDQTELTLQKSVLPSEGPPSAADTGQIITSALKTFGRLDSDPLLKFKAHPQRRSLPYLASQIALSAGVYQVHVDVDAIQLEEPYIANRGNISFNVAKTRITRLPVDWVYDETDQRLLILLSNAQKATPDLLVQYDLERDIYRVIHTFEADVQVYRIARRSSTIYYILARSKGALTVGATGSIYEYNTTTLTLTERVAQTSTHRPRIAVQYYNHTIGIAHLADKGSFKCVGNDLYYRSVSGVARLASDGTTTAMLTDSGAETSSFAFDVTETDEDIYLTTFRGVTDTQTLNGSTGTFSTTHSHTYNIRALGSGTYSLTTNFRLRSSRTLRLRIWVNNVLKLDTSVAPPQFGTPTVNESLGSFTNISSIRYTITGHSSGRPLELFGSRITATGSTRNALKIQKRSSGGTTETLLSESHSAATSPYAVQEALVHNNHLYLIRQTHDSDNLQTSQVSTLERYDLSVDPITRSILDTSTLSVDGAVHLFVHDDAPHVMYNLPLSTGVPILVDELGSINRIESDGTLTSLGNLWYETAVDRAWNLSVVRPLSIGDDIHTIMGYGNLRQSFSFSPRVYDARKKDNAQHFVYTKDLRYVISGENFSGNIYTNLAALARLMNATLSFESDVVIIRHRRAITAETKGATGPGIANIDFDSQSRAFPTSGYLRIGDEFLRYTGIRNDAFTGISRGILGTTIANHSENSKITYMHSVFNAKDLLKGFTVGPDTTNIYNVVRNSSGSLELRDDDSIRRYGERVYTLDIGRLTDHDLAWQKNILQQYLDNLKDLKYLVNIKLKRTTRLSLGDIIGIKYAELIYVIQIVSIKDGAHIEVRGRTV